MRSALELVRHSAAWLDPTRQIGLRDSLKLQLLGGLVYVGPDDTDREIREIRNLVRSAVSERDDLADRYCSREEMRPAGGTDPDRQRTAPPYDSIPAPPLWQR
jgi:hypothetical protein